MMKKVLALFTVLVVHSAAARAQQSPQQSPPGPAPGASSAQGYPYAPPPGYSAPPSGPAEAPPPPQSPAASSPNYGSAPPAYGPPPSYGAPPPYGYGAPPNRYPPPYYYYYPPAPPPRNVLDRPFTLGGGLGFGGISFNDGSGRSTSHSGFAYTFRLGFGLRPGLLLLWDVEGTAVPAGATYASASQLANLAALQLFPTRRLFFKGGFGVAELLVENDSPIWGGAAMLGIGYELVQGWNWSFDIEATVTGARYHNSGSDETWTNWSLVNFALNFF